LSREVSGPARLRRGRPGSESRLTRCGPPSPIRGSSRRLVLRNPAGEASEGRDQSAGYARRSHSHAIADVGSIPTVSTVTLVLAVRAKPGLTGLTGSPGCG